MKYSVLFLISNFRSGGAETQFWNLIRNLDREKYVVHVVQIENKNRKPIVKELEGTKVNVVRARFQLDPKTILKLYQYVRKNDIHIIQSLLFMDNQFARSAGLLTKVPVLTSVRGELLPILGRVKTYIELKMQRLSCKVIVNSYWLKNQLITMGADPEKLKVIHNGIDFNMLECGNKEFSLRSHLGISRDSVIVGIVARLHPMKDHLTYLNVMEKLIKENNNIYGLIIGDGEEKNLIENYIKNKKLTDNILMPGEVKENIGCWYRDLDVLLFTSKWGESFPNVILEAMSCHVPVVATNVSAVKEIINAEENGLLADIGDVEALVTKVMSVIKDKSFRDMIIKNARKKVDEFQIDVMTKSFEELFEKIGYNSNN